jgi:uncharacterized protein
MTEPLLKFPCEFPIKIMGATVDGFANAICALVQQHDPGFDPATLEMRPSKNGRYMGLTVTVHALSQEHLDSLYRALTQHPMVKVVL